jgi:hypothetical protein
MIIEHGQRMTASLAQREMAFEVELPQVIGLREDKALPRHAAPFVGCSMPYQV